MSQRYIKVCWCYRPNGEVLFWPIYKHLSFDQGYRVQFPAGSQGIVNLFDTGMPREYNCFVKVSGEGDIRSVTIGWQKLSLGFLHA